jgi:hypothetical protein
MSNKNPPETLIKCRDCTNHFQPMDWQQVMQQRCKVCEKARLIESWKDRQVERSRKREFEQGLEF